MKKKEDNEQIEDTKSKSVINFDRINSIMLNNEIFYASKPPQWILYYKEEISKLIKELTLEEIQELETYSTRLYDIDTINVDKRNNNDWIMGLFKIYIFRQNHINDNSIEEKIDTNTKANYSKIFGNSEDDYETGSVQIRYLLENHMLLASEINIITTDTFYIGVEINMIDENIHQIIITQNYL